MPAARLLALACLALLAALPATAQNVFRCTEGGRITFSDRPCPGAPAGTAAQSATTGPAAAAPQPATMAQQAARSTAPYTPPVAPGGVLPSAAELEKRCADGDAGACDFLACANRNDRAACARAQGAPQGRGPGPRWTAVSTRDVQRPQKDEMAGVRVVREQEITIACEGGRRGLVLARRDIERYRLPDGSAHGSLEAAAGALCAR